MAPLVSILLPVRNGEETIERAIASCLDQSYVQFELIVVDDHSTDSTGMILDRLAKIDSRIVLPGAPDLPGLVPALQRAYEHSRGPYLARMDGDDFCYPLRLERQVGYLESHPKIDLCGCGVRILRSLPGKTYGEPDGGFQRYAAWINGLLEPEQIERARFIESPIVHPSVVMRREAFDEVGGYRDCEWAEDYDLWLRMIEAGKRLAKVPDILLDWNDGADRLTRTSNRYSSENFQRAKAFYLSRMESVKSRGVVVAGTGKLARATARELVGRQVRVHGFVDIKPSDPDRKIQGLPVIEMDSVISPGPDSPIHLIALGQIGSREKALASFAKLGFVEGDNLFCIA